MANYRIKLYYRVKNISITFGQAIYFHAKDIQTPFIVYNRYVVNNIFSGLAGSTFVFESFPKNSWLPIILCMDNFLYNFKFCGHADIISV